MYSFYLHCPQKCAFLVNVGSPRMSLTLGTRKAEWNETDF